jgi:hypothetical protein
VEDECIPKDLLYGEPLELLEGSRPMGRLQRRYKDVCKMDMMASDIYLITCKCCADSRQFWKAAVDEGVKRAEITRNDHLAEKRA